MIIEQLLKRIRDEISDKEIKGILDDGLNFKKNGKQTYKATMWRVHKDNDIFIGKIVCEETIKDVEILIQSITRRKIGYSGLWKTLMDNLELLKPTGRTTGNLYGDMKKEVKPKEPKTGTDYACGHHSESIIIDCNPLSVSALLQWNESVGLEGDQSQCWSCYCKESKESGSEPKR